MFISHSLCIKYKHETYVTQANLTQAPTTPAAQAVNNPSIFGMTEVRLANINHLSRDLTVR